MSALEARFVELMLRDNKFVQGLSGAKAKLIGFGKSAAIAGAAVAAAGVAAVGVGLKNFLTLGDSLQKMSDRTGVTVESLSELKHAAEQSGTDIGTVEKALRKMAKDGLDPKNFDQVAAGIAAIEDPTKRAAAAMEVWGTKTGPALLPMLRDLPSLRKEARDLGFVMSGEAAQSAVRVGDMFANLWETLKQGSVAIGAAVAPFLEVALPAIQAFATVGLQTIQGWAQSLSENVGAVSSFVSTVWGTLLDWWHGAQTAAMSGLVYITNNWSVLLQTAMTSAQLAVVRFGNQTVYFFGTVIPGWLSWFGDNWRDVFTDIASLTATIATNIWENLKGLWDGIVGLFSGEGFSFEWTPLTQGFESAIKELPQIAEREIGPLEKSLQDELNNLGDQVVQGIEQHKKDMPSFAREFVAAGDPVADLIAKQKERTKNGADEVVGATPIAGKAKAQVLGSFSAAALAAGASGGDPAANEVKALREDQKKQHRELIKAVGGGGKLE